MHASPRWASGCAAPVSMNCRNCSISSRAIWHSSDRALSFRSRKKSALKQIPFYKERWLVKPGATGWAQINRGYNVTMEDNREKLAYDLFYIKNVSFGLDLYIMFATVKILLLGRGGR